MEVRVRASKFEIEEFKKSIVWKDIKLELAMWKKGFRIERDGIVEEASDTNPSTASILLHLGDLNGRMKAVNYMLTLPDIFLQLLEDQKDDSRRNETDRSGISE
jgi:cytochrome c-type biogenesis protein CcmE